MAKPYIFYVDGMTCISCSKVIKDYLGDKVKSFYVDIASSDPKKVIIELHDNQLLEQGPQEVWNILRTEMNEIGFTSQDYDYQPSISVATEKNTAPLSFFERLQEHIKLLRYSHWFLGGIGCGAGLALLITCLASGGLSLPVMAALAVVSTLLTLALGAPSYYDAWKKLTKSGALTMDTLFAISTISVLVVSITSFFVPWLPMMFDAGLLIYGFRHIGIAIEQSIKQKISSSRFQDRVSPKVTVWINGITADILLVDVKPGDTIIVNPGDLIPLDGICETTSSIYDTNETGAVLPRSYQIGTQVLAGMQVAPHVTTPLRIKVSRTVKESRLVQLDEGIEQSLLEKAPLEIKTEQLLTYFIPTVIGLSIFSGTIISIFFPPAIAIQCAISVLLSACPCTLGLVTPLALATGTRKGADHNILFKNGKFLQQAELIDTVVFDLNGTLTTGVPTVSDYKLLDNTISDTEFFQSCSSLEKKSSHPIGKAIFLYSQCKEQSEYAVTQLDDTDHAGITGYVKGEAWAIGSLQLMHKHGININSFVQPQGLIAGESLIYISRNKKLIGYFSVSDPLREDAFHTVKHLIDRGIKVHMCTGADRETAKRYAEALGISRVYANCPAEKINSDAPTQSCYNDLSKANDNGMTKPQYIKSLIAMGHKVAMVGDAGNDANAIAASDLGIAVTSQNSDQMTKELAGAIITNGTLSPIVSVFAISQQTVANIKQNLMLSLGYNLIAILVAGGLLVSWGVLLNPAVGVALMAVQACMVLANVYRFKHAELPHLQNTTTQTPGDHKNQSSFGVMYQHLASPIHEVDLQEAPVQPIVKNEATLCTNSFWTPVAQRAKRIGAEIQDLWSGLEF